MNLMNFVNVLDASCKGFLPTEAATIANITHLAVNILKVVVPVLLIIWGMLDLGKAVMAQKEDEIKKGQQTFIKRLVAAVIVFFVVTVVGLVIKLVAPDKTEGTNIWSCAECFINGGCSADNPEAWGVE